MPKPEAQISKEKTQAALPSTKARANSVAVTEAKYLSPRAVKSRTIPSIFTQLHNINIRSPFSPLPYSARPQNPPEPSPALTETQSIVPSEKQSLLASSLLQALLLTPQPLIGERKALAENAALSPPMMVRGVTV